MKIKCYCCISLLLLLFLLFLLLCLTYILTTGAIITAKVDGRGRTHCKLRNRTLLHGQYQYYNSSANFSLKTFQSISKLPQRTVHVFYTTYELLTKHQC